MRPGEKRRRPAEAVPLIIGWKSASPTPAAGFAGPVHLLHGPAMLDREEYIEQAYLFRSFAERIAGGALDGLAGE